MKTKKSSYLIAIFLVAICSFYGCKANSAKTKSSTKTKLIKKENIALNDDYSWKKNVSVKKAKKTKVPTLIVMDEKIDKKGTCVAKVCLINNPGILGLNFSLSYDDKKIELEKVQQGEAFEHVLSMTQSKTLKNGCKFMWTGEEVKKDQIKDGPILYMKFKVKKGVKNTKTPIVLVMNKKGIYDNNLNTIKLKIQNGYIITKK